MDETPQHRRFEFKSDSSYKFWEYTVGDFSVTLRYGRIGTKGKTKIQQYNSGIEAIEAAEKKAATKQKAGYVEVIKVKTERPSNEELWTELEPHEPFLSSILDSPDDIDQYLVYADWLLERNDPRGQLILSQFSANDPKTPMWEQPNHQKQADKIQMAHWRNWMGDLTQFLEQNHFLFEFKRGFLASLQLSYLSEQIGNALVTSPHCQFLRELTILKTPNLAPEDSGSGSTTDLNGLMLLGDADFTNLRKLEFAFNERDIRPLHGKRSFQIIHSMKRLTSLKICSRIVPDDFDFLFSKEMPNLNELHIEDPFDNGPIESLCRSSWMEQLTTLKLSCNLNDRIAQRIADSLNPNVMERIDLGENNHFSEEAINTIEKTGVAVEPI